MTFLTIMMRYDETAGTRHIGEHGPEHIAEAQTQSIRPQ